MAIKRTAHDITLDSLQEIKFEYGGNSDDRLPFDHLYSIRDFIYSGVTKGIQSILVEDLSEQIIISLPPEFLCHFYAKEK